MAVDTMRAFLAKIIFTLGVLSLSGILYVSTFYVTCNHVIRPFEEETNNETHPIRPVYNTVFHPLRWFVANDSSIKLKSEKVYYGTLEEPMVSRDGEGAMPSAYIRTHRSRIHIGFTGNQSALTAFDEIEYGSYVKLVFGVALTQKHDRFINRLKSSEIINLIDDPRIKEEDFSDEEEVAIFDAFDSLEGEPQECVEKFVYDYREAVFQHCLQAGYAQNIGGGCYHVVGYSITTTVMKRAVENCGALTTQP